MYSSYVLHTDISRGPLAIYCNGFLFFFLTQRACEMRERVMSLLVCVCGAAQLASTHLYATTDNKRAMAVYATVAK